MNALHCEAGVYCEPGDLLTEKFFIRCHGHAAAVLYDERLQAYADACALMMPLFIGTGTGTAGSNAGKSSGIISSMSATHVTQCARQQRSCFIPTSMSTAGSRSKA